MGEEAVTRKSKPNNKQDSNQDNLAGRGCGDTAIMNKVDTNLSVEALRSQPQLLEDESTTRGSDWISREAARGQLHAEKSLRSNVQTERCRLQECSHGTLAQREDARNRSSDDTGRYSRCHVGHR